MIKAVLFDIDGVLIDSFEANFKFYNELLRVNGYKGPTRQEFTDMFHLNMVDVIKHFAPSAPDSEVMRIWDMGRKKTEIGYEYSLLSMPDGVEEVINKLSRKYALGLVTSRLKESVFIYSGLLELEKYFELVVSYHDTKNHKPHPEPLILAASKLGLKPLECVYIGDTIYDVSAAKDAGMKVIAYSKDKIKSANSSTDSFKKLPGLIEAL